MIRNKHILVAVLNWGLGHATRSIPVIRTLIANDNEVILASDGAALEVLQSTFPGLESINLPSYDVTYPTRSMLWNIGSQLPKIGSTIRQERQQISSYLQNKSIDIIISDNRYGSHHDTTTNIFISHQLNLHVPMSGLVNRIHARLLSPFSEIWIVDDKSRSLSGSLSETKWLPKSTSVQFLGPQSRLFKTTTKASYDIAVILSGPEPQRTFLETELYAALIALGVKAILVQGTNAANDLKSTENVAIVALADAEELSEIICASEMVVARSGYSTIMDMAKLGGHALFIPTPGQTEQIYLADRLQKKNIAQSQSQGSLNLMKAWNDRQDYLGF